MDERALLGDGGNSGASAAAVVLTETGSRCAALATCSAVASSSRRLRSRRGIMMMMIVSWAGNTWGGQDRILAGLIQDLYRERLKVDSSDERISALSLLFSCSSCLWAIASSHDAVGRGRHGLSHIVNAACHKQSMDGESETGVAS